MGASAFVLVWRLGRPSDDFKELLRRVLRCVCFTTTASSKDVVRARYLSVLRSPYS